MEEFVKECFKSGRDQEAIALIKLLPEEKRERYRKIWTEVKASVQKEMVGEK